MESANKSTASQHQITEFSCKQTTVMSLLYSYVS